IREFLRMNPPSFTSSVTTEDPENFVEELKKVFEQVEEEKLRDTEEFRSKKVKIGNESGQQKGNVNRSSFQQMQKGPAQSSASAHAPRNKSEYYDQNSQNFRSKPALFQVWTRGTLLEECPKNKQGNGNPGNRAQSSSVAPPDRAAPKGATSGTGGRANHLYAITSRQEQENSPDVVTGVIKVFAFDVYALLDPGTSLSFVTPYVANKFDVIPEKLYEPFCVSTPVGSLF
uniref:Retrotransposon gag protein n=1 Tax=Solanum tuberosum TaxID=4113 RepID=M1DFS0_SOLTU